MNRLLQEIISAKKRDLSTILSAAIERPEHLQDIPFQESLTKTSSPAIICEIKKASPSQGVICADFDPSQIAQAYQKGGAGALSVLTDVPFFQGAPENVSLAKSASGLPVLCKDFFIDPRQMQWAKKLGADAILLIMRILSDDQAEELFAASSESGLEALVETHDEEDVERALMLGSNMIGVNNRDLNTFETSLDVSERLVKYLPESVLPIAESGINSNTDIKRLQTAGFNTFLIGGSLMRSEDKTQAVIDLRGQTC